MSWRSGSEGNVLCDKSQLVEFYNSHHPDPNDPDSSSEDEMDGMFRFMKEIK